MAQEGDTGKVYRANYVDKLGRPVLILRPSFQVIISLSLSQSRTVLDLSNNYCYYRFVLIWLFLWQNSKSTKGQIKHLVYCMENAVLNLGPDQEQMVWLIDYQGFNLSHISLKVTRETAHVLQDHYPERLGLAILYNPPKFFEPFWMVRSY